MATTTCTATQGTRLADLIQPATGHTLQSVLRALQTANMQLWVIGDFLAVVITSIEQRPSGERIMAVNYIAGSGMDRWLGDWLAVQEAYGKAHDCVAIELAGRRGWQKALAMWPEYKTAYTVYRRELKNE